MSSLSVNASDLFVLSQEVTLNVLFDRLCPIGVNPFIILGF